jgi:hypothetical protein
MCSKEITQAPKCDTLSITFILFNGRPAVIFVTKKIFVHIGYRHVPMIRITPVILEFCPDLSQRVYRDKNLPITRRTSPEEEEPIQQAT